MQGLSPADYERKKDEVADSIVARLEPYVPGIRNAVVFRHDSTGLFELSMYSSRAVLDSVISMPLVLAAPSCLRRVYMKAPVTHVSHIIPAKQRCAARCAGKWARRGLTGGSWVVPMGAMAPFPRGGRWACWACP